MASTQDSPTNMAELLRKMQRDITQLQRRRIGDGVNIDGQCEYGGGAGGDGGYYGGGTDFPDPDFPDSSYPPYLNDWLTDYFADHPDVGGRPTAGWNLYYDGDTLNFGVLPSDPGSGAPFGVLWWNDDV